jgi:hypothetical protein
MLTLNVQSNSNDPKLLKKIRKSVENLMAEAKLADDKISYNIDSSFSPQTNRYIGFGRRYVNPAEIPADGD